MFGIETNHGHALFKLLLYPSMSRYAYFTICPNQAAERLRIMVFTEWLVGEARADEAK